MAESLLKDPGDLGPFALHHCQVKGLQQSRLDTQDTADIGYNRCKPKEEQVKHWFPNGPHSGVLRAITVQMYDVLFLLATQVNQSIIPSRGQIPGKLTSLILEFTWRSVASHSNHWSQTSLHSCPVTSNIYLRSLRAENGNSPGQIGRRMKRDVLRYVPNIDY